MEYKSTAHIHEYWRVFTGVLLRVSRGPGQRGNFHFIKEGNLFWIQWGFIIGNLLSFVFLHSPHTHTHTPALIRPGPNTHTTLYDCTDAVKYHRYDCVCVCCCGCCQGPVGARTCADVFSPLCLQMSVNVKHRKHGGRILVMRKREGEVERTLVMLIITRQQAGDLLASGLYVSPLLLPPFASGMMSLTMIKRFRPSEMGGGGGEMIRLDGRTNEHKRFFASVTLKNLSGSRSWHGASHLAR